MVPDCVRRGCSRHPAHPEYAGLLFLATSLLPGRFTRSPHTTGNQRGRFGPLTSSRPVVHTGHVRNPYLLPVLAIRTRSMAFKRMRHIGGNLESEETFLRFAVVVGNQGKCSLQRSVMEHDATKLDLDRTLTPGGIEITW